MRVTVQQFQAIFPHADPQLAMPLNEAVNDFGIDTETRTAAFLAQAGYESGGFTRFVENLNYSAQGLLATFPRYFHTLAEANAYARQPQKIADYVYGNRMGNGPPTSGDGYLFRGRGAIQLTGRATYMAFGRTMNMSAEQAAPFCETPRGALLSAGWFWSAHGLNRYADAKDFSGMTRVINGGQFGIADRQHLFESALQVL